MARTLSASAAGSPAGPVRPAPASCTTRAPSPSREAMTGLPEARYDCTLAGMVRAKIGSFLRVTSRASARAKKRGMASGGYLPKRCTVPLSPRARTWSSTQARRRPSPRITQCRSRRSLSNSAADRMVSKSWAAPMLPANIRLNPRGSRARSGALASTCHRAVEVFGAVGKIDDFFA